MVEFFTSFADPTLWIEIMRACEDIWVLVKEHVAYTHDKAFRNSVIDGMYVEATFGYRSGQATWNQRHITKRLTNKSGL